MKNVFICHASEDKGLIATHLIPAFQAAQITYWFDEAELKWGDSLIEKINSGLKESMYVIVILSQNFISKNWARKELSTALSIESSTGEIKVLPLLSGSKHEIRLVLQEFPLLNDKIYLVWQNNPDEVVDALLRRLENQSATLTSQRKHADSISSAKIPLPRIRKKFTQRDKDLFLRHSFQVIKGYFEHALTQLQKEYVEVEVDFIEINNFKFLAKIYVNGDICNECMLWIGGSFGPNSICYREGQNLSYNNDNTLNDSATIESDDYKLFIKLGFLGWHQGSENENVSPEEAAEHFWKRLTNNL